MTRTEELLARAKAGNHLRDISDIPEFVQLIELVRLQHEAVRQYATMMPLWKAGVEALEAFNKFEQGGSDENYYCRK